MHPQLNKFESNHSFTMKLLKIDFLYKGERKQHSNNFAKILVYIT